MTAEPPRAPEGGPHLFGAFCPDAAPETLARLADALAAAFPSGAWTGEDIRLPGFAGGVRRPRAGVDGGVDGWASGENGGAAVARLGGGAALGALRLVRTPGGQALGGHTLGGQASGECGLGALAARLAAAPDRDEAGAGPLAGLEGAFAVALIRPAHPGAGIQGAPGPRLDLARDPMGRAMLWTARGPGGEVLFCTRAQALLRAPGVSRAPDPVSLALMLVARSTGPGHGAYADLAQAPRGARMMVDARGMRVLRLRRPAPDPALRALAPDDAMAALRAQVHGAILAWADAGGAVGLEFSGGLDSSLIAGVLAAAGREVRGFAAVPRDAADAGAERAARAAMGAMWPGLSCAEIPPEGADFLAAAAAWQGAAAMPCPDPMAFNALHLGGAMTAAGVQGALSGMGGDFCLSSHGAPPLPERWRMGGPRAALADIARRRAAGGRLRNILIGDLIKPLGGFEAWRRLRPAPAPAILGARAQGPALAARMAAAGVSFHERRWLSVAAEDAAQIDALPPWTVQTLPGTPQRLTPLLDAAVIDAALAMPPGLRAHHGLPRGLIRRLLEEVAPPEIALRPDKAPFQPDYARLQRAAIPRIRAEARAFRSDPLWREVVNAPVWDAALDAAERAGPLEGLELSNIVMMPFFLGWWLVRRDDQE